jgi:cyclopropane fatty-acyl-phospholipid synthase-like methyltransferase
MTPLTDPRKIKTAGLSAQEEALFVTVPRHIQNWTRKHGGVAGQRILDFGCGTGVSAAGMALLMDAAHVHGVDINLNHAGCQAFLSRHFGLASLPDTLTFEKILPGETGAEQGFDIAYSWSTFEHVGNRYYPGILAGLRERIVPGGLFFVQIGPLYFSPEGGHLWALGWRAWEHLAHQFSDIEDAIAYKPGLTDEERRSLNSMFRSLNRITADDLLARIEGAGFSLLRQQRSETTLDPPAALLSAYRREALTTVQIVALFQRD